MNVYYLITLLKLVTMRFEATASISTLLFHPLRFSKFYYQFLLQNPSPKNAADIKPSMKFCSEKSGCKINWKYEMKKHSVKSSKFHRKDKFQFYLYGCMCTARLTVYYKKLQNNRTSNLQLRVREIVREGKLSKRDFLHFFLPLFPGKEGRRGESNSPSSPGKRGRKK